MRRSPGFRMLALAGVALAVVGLAGSARSVRPAGTSPITALSSQTGPDWSSAADPGATSPALAATPPMGWNSWNAYACDNSEKNMRAVATFIHDSGLQRDGYQYVNADGCYNDLQGIDSPNTHGVFAPTRQNPETCGAINGRLPDGQIFLNPYAFPPSRPCANNGFTLVSTYVHSLGLKFGTYLDASNNWNCEETPGSYGFDPIDAQSLVTWGVDYVKADWGCKDSTIPPGSNAPAGYTGVDAAPGNQGFGGPTFSTNPAFTVDEEHTQIEMYTALSNAIRNAGRPMVLSVAGASTVNPQDWGPQVGQLVRPTPDSNANFVATGKHAPGSVVGLVNADAQTYDRLTEPGHWIDPDIMEVGNGSLTAAEDRSEMSMFSEMAEPLMMSTNLCAAQCGPNTTPATPAQLALAVSVFGNRRVIAVDQDSLGSPAHIVGTFDGTNLVMAKPLADGSVAVTMFNESTAAASRMRATAAALGLPAASGYRVQDLWSGRTSTSTGSFSATVAPTATAMYRITPVSAHATGPTQRSIPSIPSVAPVMPVVASAGQTADAATERASDLFSVSCGSATRCTGVDNFGHEVTFNPTTPARATPIEIDPGRSLVSVSCPAGTGRCTALAGGGSEFTFRPSLTRVSGVSSHAVDAGHQPTAIACASGTQCTVVDGEGYEVTFSPATGRINAAGRQAVDPYRYLGAVTCRSSARCTAVGGGGDGGDTEVTFDPRTGTVTAAGRLAVDPATGNGVSSVSCPSTVQCTVVDGSGNEVTFNPRTGAVTAAAAPLEGGRLVSGLGVMSAVSCARPSRCTAVDESGNEVTFDPVTGTVTAAGVQLVDPAGNGLESVSCPPPGARCVAVDLDGRAVSFSVATG